LCFSDRQNLSAAIHAFAPLTRLVIVGTYAAMTKADIVETVYEKVGGFSKKEAAEIVETVFDTIKVTLERGEKIKISGFGNFVVRDKNSRTGRNPQTGEEITITARRVLTFKPSQVLKNSLNDFGE
jgi:integration host factor subunit alpha